MFSIEKINEIHNNDINQMNIVTSEEKRIIVEAPAGCGKTKTMISKIAYLLSTNKIESTKKILALTFSVNAAYKIKKDVLEQLPKIIECDSIEASELTNKIVVSNYHGFCRRLLSLYGRLITRLPIDFNTIVAIADDRKTLEKHNISEEIIVFLNEFSEKLKSNDTCYILKNYKEYNSIIKGNFLNNGIITHNAIILLAYELLCTHKTVKEFYNKYFPIILIDEFQDTNIIAWLFVRKLISKDTNIIIMGDPLQRIYGFIGAVPNIMEKAEKKFNMVKYELNINYRFKDNHILLALDKNIRLNAKQKNNNQITDISNPYIISTEDQIEEANWIGNKVDELNTNDKQVAILVRSNGKNTEIIKNYLDSKHIEYFFALFSDEDIEYVKFHDECLKRFNVMTARNSVVTVKRLKGFYKLMEETNLEKTPLINSLLKLLKVFITRIFEEYAIFPQEEKIRFIKETFENRTLRQNMDKIQEKCILATIHASKGLEFQNVILVDVEKMSIPSYWTCKNCYNQNQEDYSDNQKRYCYNVFISDNEKEYLDELSVFYVGITRAKEELFLTYSRKNVNGYSAIPSCFLKLNGIGTDNLKIIEKENKQ